MLVCLVSHTVNMGGAERSMMDLIEALTLRGVECRVIVPDRGDLTEMMEARRVPYSVSYFRPWCWSAGTSLWDRLLKQPVMHVVRAVRLARVIRAWNCDVMLTNTLAVCEGAMAARLLAIPHVTYVKEFGDPGYGHHFEFGLRRSVRILSMLSKRMVFVSHSVATHFKRDVPGHRMRIVYNAVVVRSDAIDVRRQRGVDEPDAALVCVCVGTVLEAKGQKDAVLAVHELVRRDIPVKLKIVGGGASEDITRLKEFIHTLDLDGHIEITGHVVDPYPLFSEADAVLMCSRLEAFGRVTVEAMKMGRPVIGARGGATPEIIRDGFNGVLYAPGDWMDLADKIQTFYGDLRAAREMGERGRAWATHTFNVERYGNDMLAVLMEAAGDDAAVKAR